jgi:hypothetical protein
MVCNSAGLHEFTEDMLAICKHMKKGYVKYSFSVLPSTDYLWKHTYSAVCPWAVNLIFYYSVGIHDSVYSYSDK